MVPCCHKWSPRPLTRIITIDISFKPIEILIKVVLSLSLSLSLAMAKQLVDGIIADNKVAVFSKTYCPFCKMAKEALDSTGVKYFVLELDERGEYSNEM